MKEIVTPLAFWIPFGLMTYFCFWQIRRNIRRLNTIALSEAEISITKLGIAIMILPLLAFSSGFLFFTIRIITLILGL